MRIPDERASDLLRPQAYDPEYRVFLCDDKSLGFGFICAPLSGADDAVANHLSVLFNSNWPEDTILQFSLIAFPDIRHILDLFMKVREPAFDPNGGDPLLRRVTNDRHAYLRSCIDLPMNDYSHLRLRDFLLLVTVKIPISGSGAMPEEKDLRRSKELSIEVGKILDGLHMQPTTLTPSAYIHLMNGILNQGEHAHWRQSSSFDWDEHRPIAEQIFDHDAPIVVHDDHLEVGNHHITVLSVKQFPKLVAFGGMINLIGDMTTGASAIACPFVLTANIHIPNSHTTQQKLARRQAFLTKQAYGPLTAWVPGLFSQKEGYDELTRAIADGGRPLHLALSLMLITGDRDSRIEAVSQAIQLWQGNRMVAMPDKLIMLPMALAVLPFGAELSMVQQLQRYRTMSTQHVVRLLPIFTEWRGTSTPLMTFVSRTGQLMAFSQYDSNTNYNVVIAAESGGGKSFMTNEMIASSRAAGAIVRVIDIGRSYEKLAESLGGANLVFGPDAKLDLNPFPLVTNWSEDRDVLMGLIEAMAAPTMPLTDLQRASLGDLLSQVWEMHGHAARIDDVAAALLNADDPRVRDIGVQLYPFTVAGDYGRYFDGSGQRVDFQNSFITLELEELAGSDHLRKVVLLVLIYRIQQEAYLGDRSVKKLLIIDEAWQLMDSPSVAAFLNSAFRRFRKYNASAVVITQSLNDFFQTSTGVGKAILENAATIMLLAQKGSTLEKLKVSGDLPIDAAYLPLIKTVHVRKDEYSEVFIATNKSGGIGRLYVTPFAQLLYSTAPADVSAINRYRQQGLTVEQAIERVLDERSGKVILG
tara:strand:- start:13852 stop:16284 length:2433 start_codon:yes stop_codon:yes gene_type:complete